MTKPEGFEVLSKETYPLTLYTGKGTFWQYAVSLVSEDENCLLLYPYFNKWGRDRVYEELKASLGENPLDNSAVHPESYPIVERMAKDLGCSVAELIADKELKKRLDIERYITEKVGLPTLRDILQELDKPGRDPRQAIQVFAFDPNVKSIEDVRAGQILPGIVTNITNFGCFVDIGIKENGLVHISELADRFVSDPTQVVSIHQHVRVKVLSVDLARKRVQLSMKGI